MPYLGRTVVTNLADYHVDGYTHVGSSPSSSQFIAGTTSALTLTNAGVDASAWKTYRQKLRDITKDADLDNPTWPTKPS
tara:strand:- start:390 stop:626 length:237 start_codon:yes stop_codon:yes gene_type:complete